MVQRVASPALRQILGESSGGLVLVGPERQKILFPPERIPRDRTELERRAETRVDAAAFRAGEMIPLRAAGDGEVLVA